MAIERVNHLNHAFYNTPWTARQTMTLQQLQETMMYTEGFITAQGYSWTIQKKSLAPSVYLVTLKKGLRARD